MTRRATVPRICRATPPQRVAAMVKTVTIGVRATHSHALSWSWCPRRLVDVAHRGLSDVLPQLGDGRLQHGGRLPPQLGDDAQRDRQTEQVAGQLLDRPLT